MTVPGTINSSTGVFTAATTDGTYPGAIEAAVGAVTGTATVVVAAANGWRQHEPAGMTQFLDSPFNTVAGSAGGTAEGWTTDYNGNWTQVTDATAPVSPSNVGRMTFTTSQAYGSAPNTLYATVSGAYTKMYICIAFKTSANYYGPGHQKLVYIYMPGTGIASVIEVAIPQATTGNCYPFVETEGTGHDGNYWPTVTTDICSRGSWHIYEYYMVLNTPGVANGLVQFWVDGVNYDGGAAQGGSGLNPTAFQLSPSGGASTFNGTTVQLSPTYGGGGTPQSPPATQTIDFDEIYVSVG